MKVLYFDPILGASGDMILASLIDLGVDPDCLRKKLKFVPGSKLLVKQVNRNGISAKQVRFICSKKIGEKDFLPLINKSRLPGHIKERAAGIIKRIFKAEMKVHRAHHLHLHELADADTLLDITGALLAIDYLAVKKIYTRPLKAGTGFVNTREGKMPAFNFATANLLTKFPVEFMPVPFELTTPTGAAILSTIAQPVNNLVFDKLESIGLGTGTMDLGGYPNFLRAFMGETGSAQADECLVIETNIDDQNPQDYEIILEKLYAAGAKEVFLTPVIMKNSRPGIMMTVLCSGYNQEILDTVFEHTTTLGLRMHYANRIILKRRVINVRSPYGRIRVKIFEHNNHKRFSLEYQDLKKITLKTNRPLAELRSELLKFTEGYLRAKKIS